MAYLPPAELSRKFEQYRDLLRATDGHFALLSTLVTIHGSPFSPSSTSAEGRDAESRAGYAQLVQLLCQRRLGRRVYLAVGSGESGTDSVARLEGKVSSLIERLTTLGLKPVRLKDRALFEAARRFGWTETGAGT
jgi:hypothetical protein